METKTIDLLLEKKESLESVDNKTKEKWTNEKYKTIAICVGGFLLGVVSLYFSSSSSNQNGSLIENMISAPKNFLTLIFVLVMLACVVITPLVLVISLINLVMGIPKAPKNPEKTVRNYYLKSINQNGNLPKVDASAFLLLLDQAKNQFNDVNGFIEYYKDVIGNIQNDIASQFQSVAKVGLIGAIGQNSYSIKKVNELSASQYLKTFEVYIEAVHKIQTSVAPEAYKTLGSVLIKEVCTVANVGERWYLTSGSWTGSIIK